MTENEMSDLLDRIHDKLLLHPDAGTTRMETNSSFWNVFYGFEKELSEKLANEDN